MVNKILKAIDKNNMAMFGKSGSMKNASIFTAPGLEKSVKADRKMKIAKVKKITKEFR